MRPPALAVVLAVCCVLAGCNAFAPGTTADRSIPSVTPADVPDGAPDRLAPGLTADAITNVTALLDAHGAVLANRSVHVERRTTTRADDGGVRDEQVVEYRFAADRSRIAIDVTGRRHSPASLWSNDTSTIIREGRGADVRYRAPRGSYGTLSPTDLVARTLRGSHEGAVRAVATERLGRDAGGDVFRVTVDWDGSRTTVLTVDERGLIRRVAERDARANGDPAPVQVTTVTADVGRVERPDWVDRARRTIADREYVAPGVTTERVIDARALREAHLDATRETSTTYVSKRWANASNGTVLRYDRTAVRVSADRSERRALAERYGDGRSVRSDRWQNETSGYRRTVADDVTSYYETGAHEYSPNEPRLGSELERSAVTITELADGRYRLVTDDHAAATVGIDGAIVNPRLVVVFDDRGVVSRIARTYTVEGRGADRHVEQTTRFTNLGNTTVERPDWLPAARNATA